MVVLTPHCNLYILPKSLLISFSIHPVIASNKEVPLTRGYIEKGAPDVIFPIREGTGDFCG
jgi:hypothetical protein